MRSRSSSEMAARGSGNLPLRQQLPLVEREPSLLHQDADERIEHALRHRPAGHRHVGGDAGRIPLGNDAPVVHDDDRVGAAQPPWVWLLEGGVDELPNIRSGPGSNAQARDADGRSNGPAPRTAGGASHRSVAPSPSRWTAVRRPSPRSDAETSARRESTRARNGRSSQ